MRAFAIGLALLTPVQAVADWEPVIPDGRGPVREWRADDAALRARIAPGAVIALPLPSGGTARVRLDPAQVMAPELAARYPQIRAFRARGVDDPGLRARIELDPTGLHALLDLGGALVAVDPVGAGRYRLGGRAFASSPAARGVDAARVCRIVPAPLASRLAGAEPRPAARTSGGLRRLRLAVAASGEYTQFHGGTVAGALAAIVTAVNRVNLIFERDLAVTLELVAANDALIFTNPVTDPFTLSDPDLMLTENQTAIDARIGSAAYDLGHLVTTFGGGLATVESACLNGFKAQAHSGHPAPDGERFYVDILAHELGHQLGALHSFNGTDGDCASNRSAGSAWEPGGGSTIMSYSGLCNAEDIAIFSDPVFHAGSIGEIVGYLGGAACGTPVATTNSAPDVDAGANLMIPRGTPFTLAGAAVDGDGDTLSYQWDELDLGSATDATSFGTDLGDNPLFRSFTPRAQPTRTLPRFGTLLGPGCDPAENPPTMARTLNFRLTARDGNGGVDEDDTVVTVDGRAGPFRVIAPNGGENWVFGGVATVSWDPAGTAAAPIRCADVNVDLLVHDATSTRFCATRLASGVANSGSTTIVVPDAATARARIRISCATGPFFALSAQDFSVSASTAASDSCEAVDGVVEPHAVAASADGAVLGACRPASFTAASDDSGGGGAMGPLGLVLLALFGGLAGRLQRLRQAVATRRL